MAKKRSESKKDIVAGLLRALDKVRRQDRLNDRKRAQAADRHNRDMERRRRKGRGDE